MFRGNRTVFPWVALSVGLMLAVGCSFGQKARDQALLPALLLASDGVQEDALAGVDALPPGDQASPAAQIETFFAALREEPPAEMARLLWPAIATLAESGIQARLDSGTIGPHVAASFRERLARFGEGISTYFREES